MDLLLLEKNKLSHPYKSRFGSKFRAENEETFYCQKDGGGLLTNQPAVALTASNKEIAELILLFINNAWLRTDNL